MHYFGRTWERSLINRIKMRTTNGSFVIIQSMWTHIRQTQANVFASFWPSFCIVKLILIRRLLPEEQNQHVKILAVKSPIVQKVCHIDTIEQLMNISIWIINSCDFCMIEQWIQVDGLQPLCFVLYINANIQSFWNASPTMLLNSVKINQFYNDIQSKRRYRAAVKLASKLIEDNRQCAESSTIFKKIIAWIFSTNLANWAKQIYIHR